jgi:TolB-like protein/Tfp pilus assembly protein PilF
VEAGALISELKRRRVIRALVGYGIAAFAVLQIIEPIMHGLHWPDEVLSYTVVALAVGFPVVVSLAWIFDVKSGRIERTTATQPMRTRVWLMLVGIGLLAAAPGVVWYFLVRGTAKSTASAPAGAPPIRSIAVLSFADLSPAKDQEYFSDGIAEEILNALAHVEGLRVSGRTSAFSFKGRNEDVRAIGEKLNVGFVLEGSVRKEGNRVRITTQIVNVADGYHLWSESFDRELKGIFAVQEEIARAVVEALKVKVLPGKALAAREHRTANPEVYNQYLLGKQFLNRASEDGTRRAKDALEKALALDPAYAPAWAALAEAVYMLGDAFGGTAAAVAEGQERGKAAAERAVALAPDLADGYVARATIRRLLSWDWPGAQADLERALSINPGDAVARKEYADLLATLGRVPEAITALRKAAEIDPLSGRIWNALGRCYSDTGQLELARSAFSRALEISPEYYSAHFSLGTTFLLEGQPGAAQAVFDLAPLGWRLLGTAMAQHGLGHPQESQQAIEAQIARAGHKAAFQIAEVYAWRGEKDRAFEWLERAYAQRDGGLAYVKYSPLLRSLRGGPRYTALLKKLNLPLD